MSSSDPNIWEIWKRLDALEKAARGILPGYAMPKPEDQHAKDFEERQTDAFDAIKKKFGSENPATCLTDGSPVTADHRDIRPNGMQKGYVVLCPEERDKGISRVKAKNSDFVETMRAVARRLARNKDDRVITADDLREWLKQHPEIGEPSHYNCFGAIFSKNKDFEFSGFTISKQKQGHGNRLIRWRLVVV